MNFNPEIFALLYKETDSNYLAFISVKGHIYTPYLTRDIYSEIFFVFLFSSFWYVHNVINWAWGGVIFSSPENPTECHCFYCKNTNIEKWQPVELARFWLEQTQRANFNWQIVILRLHQQYIVYMWSQFIFYIINVLPSCFNPIYKATIFLYVYLNITLEGYTIKFCWYYMWFLCDVNLCMSLWFFWDNFRK